MTTSNVSRDTTVLQKPNSKNRDDLKVIITATALTLTLAFWNVFSNGTPKPVEVTTSLEPSVTPQAVPFKILLGGPPPKTTIIVSQPSVAQPRNQHNNNQQQAPKPVTKTSSSK